MEAVFLAFLNAGVMASWTVLAVLLVRQLCRKCPRKIAVLFWLPVGFRFLIPASLPSPLSIFNLLRSGVETNETALTVNQYVPSDIGMMEAPQVSVGIGSVDEIVSAALPAAEPTYSANPMQIWTAIGAWVWVIGMVVMLTWAIVRYALLRRRLRFAVPVAGQPDTYTGEMVPTPFLTGIFRPRIYLPLGLDEVLTDTVLRHERAHIRYRDPVWKLAAYLVLTVHWYNPLCWAAVMLLGRDLELRCDEAVLAEVDAKTYGMALVTLAAGRRFSPVSPLAFGESSVGSRVKHILKWKKPARWVGILAGVICVALVVVFATDAMVEQSHPRGVTVQASGGLYRGEAFPPELETILTDIQNLPEERRTHYPDKEALAKSQPKTRDEKVYFFLWETQETLLTAILSVLSEDTVAVWCLEEVPDRDGEGVRIRGEEDMPYDTQTQRALFTFADREITAALIRFCEGFSEAYPHDISDTDELIFHLEKMASIYYPNTEEVQLNGEPSIHFTGFQKYRLYLETDGPLTVQELYYEKVGSGTRIDSTILTLEKDRDGMFTLPVKERNPGAGETVVYYIQHGDGRYVLWGGFPKEGDTGDETMLTSEEDTPTSILVVQHKDIPFFLRTEEIDYDKVPTIPSSGDRFLRLSINAGEVLTVQEHYYIKMNDGALMATSTIHELPRDADGFYTLAVKERNPGEGETIIYCVEHDDGYYVFRVAIHKDLPITPLK